MPEKRSNDNTEQGLTPLGQYYLVEKLAQGGMAEIFKGLAYDIHGMKRTVVIKKILPHIAANRESIDMLISEAKIAVQLSHGNIAQIYDLGKVNEDYFMVMEYVDGKSLSQIHKRCLKRGELIPLPYICYVMSETAEGLDYMHRKIDETGKPLDIVHRDISPQNIIVSYSGTVKIIDFGIAKSTSRIDATEAGVLKGKFAYMSPEQARGEEIDGRSDIFSMGIIMHELMTGRRLFKMKDNKETIKNVRRSEVQPPSTFNDKIPKELDDIVMKALAKDPDHRYRLAGDVSNDLSKLIHTKFTGFRPELIVDFVSDLFKNDAVDAIKAETEHTPYLIIDRTQSVINMSAPQVMKEFMLDEGSKSEKIEDEPQEDSEDEEVSETKRLTFLREKILGALRYIEPVISKYALSIAAVVAVMGIVYFGWKFGMWQAWSSFFKPVELSSEEMLEEVKPTIEGFVKLNVESRPSGASIFIDNIMTSLTTPAVIENISADSKARSIGIFLKGYKFWSTNFVARPEETVIINADLVQAFSSLEVISDPLGATIFINNEPAGMTPYRSEELEPNLILNVRVEKEGFTPWERDIKTLQEQAVILRPRLISIPKKKVQ